MFCDTTLGGELFVITIRSTRERFRDDGFPRVLLRGSIAIKKGCGTLNEKDATEKL